jgi:ABC-type multidrug transport system fused ATPase/permease subunit
MAFEEIKEHLSEADQDFRSYLETTKEYYHLKTFKVLMKGINALIKALLLGAISILALFMFSMAMAFGLGQLLENTFYGFLLVGIFYLLIGICVYIFRNRLDGPMLRKFSEIYFDEL